MYTVNVINGKVFAWALRITNNSTCQHFDNYRLQFNMKKYRIQFSSFKSNEYRWWNLFFEAKRLKIIIHRHLFLIMSFQFTSQLPDIRSICPGIGWEFNHYFRAPGPGTNRKILSAAGRQCFSSLSYTIISSLFSLPSLFRTLPEIVLLQMGTNHNGRVVVTWCGFLSGPFTHPHTLENSDQASFF